MEGGEQLSLVEFVASSDFAVDVAENWQSEYLQFVLYVSATVWLIQRGSPESKPVGAPPRLPRNRVDQAVAADHLPSALASSFLVMLDLPLMLRFRASL